jgi:ubiquinone biosynthesis protein
VPSVLDTVRDLGRLREIAGVLARHGFGELIARTDLGKLAPWRPGAGEAPSLTPAVRLRKAMEELGPTFVKLGQLVSTRPDLIPADIIEEMKRLQDDVPPLPFETMRPVIEEQLGAPLAKLYANFDEHPLASASIGQVYRARLTTDAGEIDVAVKVQRPNIAQTIERDLDLLYWLAHALERSVPEVRVYCPVKLVGEFDRAIRAELDYALEADNAERFAEDFAGVATVAFPPVYRNVSTGKVITLGYIDGKDVFDAVREGASGETIAKNAIEIIIRMIFEHGFFHADPHPGNILITGAREAPVIGLLDLGLVGHLSPRARDRLVELVIALGREDPRAISSAVYALGRPTRKVDRVAFEAEVTRLTEKYMRKRLSDIPFADVIRDVAGGALRYGIEVPPELLMVGKAIMTVEGIGRQIFPQLDLARELRPHLAQVVGMRYSPERITNDLIHLATRLSTAASEFPARAEDLLEDMRQGRVSLEVRQPSVTQAAERLGRRVFAGLGVGSLVLSAALLFVHGRTFFALLTLAVAVGWSAMHAIAMALGRNQPPR